MPILGVLHLILHVLGPAVGSPICQSSSRDRIGPSSAAPGWCVVDLQ